MCWVAPVDLCQTGSAVEPGLTVRQVRRRFRPHADSRPVCLSTPGHLEQHGRGAGHHVQPTERAPGRGLDHFAAAGSVGLRTVPRVGAAATRHLLRIRRNSLISRSKRRPRLPLRVLVGRQRPRAPARARTLALVPTAAHDRPDCPPAHRGSRPRRIAGARSGDQPSNRPHQGTFGRVSS